MNRRRFLTGAAGTLAAASVPAVAMATTADPMRGDIRKLIAGLRADDDATLGAMLLRLDIAERLERAIGDPVDTSPLAERREIDRYLRTRFA